jgi:hypothetical protein
MKDLRSAIESDLGLEKGALKEQKAVGVELDPTRGRPP